MFMLRHALRVTLIAVCLVASTLPVAGAPPQDRADLQGVWILNRDRSDTLSDQDRGNPKSGWLGSGPGMGGNGPMGGAGVKGPLTGGRGVDPALRERMRELARVAFEAPERLVVTDEGSALRLVNDDGHVTRLEPNGSKTQEIAGTLQVERRTRWDKGRLVTELKAKDGGGEVKQVYTRDGNRLLVESTFEGEVASRAETMKFVYDLQEK